jgi:general secretion pathway protein N
MTLCPTNRAFILTVLTGAATAVICTFQARSESLDRDVNSAATEITQTHQPKISGASATVGNAVLAIPLSKLSMTRDRPIFSLSRRPPPPPPPAIVIAKPIESPKPEAEQQPPLILVGTVAGGGSEIAVFVEQATENVVKLRLNESHRGWILRSIQGREVTLLKGPKSSVLALAPPGGNAEPPSAQATLEPPRRSSRR